MVIARGLVSQCQQTQLTPSVGNTVNRIIRMNPEIHRIQPGFIADFLSGFIQIKPDLGRIIHFIVLTDNPLIRSNKFVG